MILMPSRRCHKKQYSITSWILIEGNHFDTDAVFVLGAAAAAVDYPAAICAVRGSTVTLLCSFTPLTYVEEGGQQFPIEIVRVRWCQNHLICQGSTPSVYDSQANNNNPRYKYLGDKKSNCTLQITDIDPRDEATFRFRMEANHIKGHFTDQLGVNISVAGKSRTFSQKVWHEQLGPPEQH